MLKRQLAVLLSTAMVFTTAIPSTVFGEEVPETIEIPTLETEASEETEQVGETELNDTSADEEPIAEIEAEENVESEVTDQENGTEPESETEPEKEQGEDKSEDPVVKAELSEDEKTITLTATGIDSEATAVVFPTWSTVNGQDDLEWAAGKKQEDGSWTAVVSAKKHKGTGDYSVHCYQTVNGSMAFVGKTTVTLSKPEASIQVEDLDALNGKFNVRITDVVVPSGISKIDVPIWGDADGQNDLVWYQAEKDGEDYIVKVDASDHGYENGIYNVHCYITDGNGNQSFVQKTTAELAMENGLKAELSADETSIKVTAQGIATNADSVVFPVWSEKNGQDDLKWVKATKSGNGVWTAAITVKGFKDQGAYAIHCYQTVNGVQTFFDKTTVTVTIPTGTLETTAADENTGTFEASLSSMNIPAGVEKVEFAVWGNADGQNDLVWHNATKQGDKYVASIAPGEHQFETGTYNVHCYVRDKNGFFLCVGKTEVEVNMKEGISAIVSSDQKTVQIQYIGPKAGQKLSAAVWSDKDGQDDLTWYSMTKSGNGAVATVKIANHKSAGNYNVHIYTSGSQFVGKSTFSIDAMGTANVAVSEINGNKGTFKVTVSGLSTPSGIEKVMIPVWPNGDQSKINWYAATKSGDTYVCTVDVSKHGYSFGHYDVHAYGYANNGVWGFTGGSSAELNADRFMYSEKTGTYSTRVWLINAGTDATGVSFKAWSDTNGTDDVVSYIGVKSGSNNYYADVLSSKHKNGGNYTTEAYVTTAAGSTLAGKVSYTMAKEGEAKNQKMYEYAQGFSSDTNYLILVNRGLHRVAIYQGSRNNWKEIKYWPCVVGKPSTPTPTGTFKIKGRFDWFGDGHKCWWATQIEGYYYFHTVLYYWDDAPRKILDGTMDAAASMGCIRLDEPNARWIYTTIPRGTTVHIYN